ncbi:MAG: beta-galactosidase [Treponema sp.]|nr:beta-galactosidase [Treponema sp.]
MFFISLCVFFICVFSACSTPGGAANRQGTEGTLREIESVKLPEIERLLGLCRERRLAVDYEMVDYSVIKDFTGYVRDDLQNRNITRAAYGVSCLEELSGNVLTSLNAYLAGTKKPQEVTRYVTGSVEIRGGSMIGRAVNPVSGGAVTRPLFFTGYGHFDQIVNDMHKMTGYGADIMQTEVGPWHTVIEQGNGYAFNASGVERIPNILREAERQNVRVDVLLAPHYFPQWVLQKYPHLNEKSDYFLKFNMHDPEAKKVIETHIKGVMERIKDYRSLNSVCLSNEPVFSAAKNFNVNNKNAVINVMWWQFLTDTHRTIENLNSIYKTAYTGFDSVPMPREIEASPLFYDWMTFNDKIFADWHQWMADIIRAIAPNVPVHAKLMDAVLSPAGGRTALQWGINPEHFSHFSQLNGNDSYNLLFRNDAGITSKMKWYDLLMSLKKMPVFNSEDHIIEDRSGNYIPQQAKHVRADIWQGAVHGRAASVIWVWERTHDKNSDFAGSVLHRPDVVSAIGRTNLDLNRLSNEVTALQNEPARAAVLFSNPARIYDEAYLNTTDKAYKSLIFNGQKAGFITEKQLASGDYSGFRVIIIPSAVHVMPETLSAIRNFINRGGNVLVLGENSLSMDYYNRAINNADRNFIMENSTVIRYVNTLTEAALHAVVRNILTERSLNMVTLIDNKTGNPVYGVEWLSAEYNRRQLVNICNYDWNGAKSVRVLLNGRQAGNAAELITGERLNTANIELAPYSPVLISID